LSFCAAINCMDGRVQEPVINHLKRRFQVKFVDMITESGPIRFLSTETDPVKVNSILERVEVSIIKHDVSAIAVIGHHDCAGNPMSRDVQVDQLRSAVSMLREKFAGCEVAAFYVEDDWTVTELHDI